MFFCDIPCEKSKKVNISTPLITHFAPNTPRCIFAANLLMEGGNKLDSLIKPAPQVSRFQLSLLFCLLPHEIAYLAGTWRLIQPKLGLTIKTDSWPIDIFPTPQ